VGTGYELKTACSKDKIETCQSDKNIKGNGYVFFSFTKYWEAITGYGILRVACDAVSLVRLIWMQKNAIRLFLIDQ